MSIIPPHLKENYDNLTLLQSTSHHLLHHPSNIILILIKLIVQNHPPPKEPILQVGSFISFNVLAVLL